MNKLSFSEFSDSDSLSLRREKLNELLNYVKELEQTLSQFSDLFAFIKSTYNSKPYFFKSIDAMANCKFLQTNFTCICLTEVEEETYLSYYKITNSETSASDGINIIDIVSDFTLKAVKIPDLFGIEDLSNRVKALELESEFGGEHSG